MEDDCHWQGSAAVHVRQLVATVGDGGGLWSGWIASADMGGEFGGVAGQRRGFVGFVAHRADGLTARLGGAELYEVDGETNRVAVDPVRWVCQWV